MMASHTQSIPYFGIIFVLCASRWHNVKTSGTLVFVTPDKFNCRVWMHTASICVLETSYASYQFNYCSRNNEYMLARKIPVLNILFQQLLMLTFCRKHAILPLNLTLDSH